MELNKNESPKIFDRIAERYDILNRVLSLGIDVNWRKKLSHHLPDKKNINLLDIATGTGDQIIFLLSDNIEKAVGVDLSEGMLAQGQKKIADLNLNDRVSLKKGDACELPLLSNQFDVSTISFGIRNVPDVKRSLQEMFRVLRPGGRALILEFSLPENILIKTPYLFYFRNILPQIGSYISGDSTAYKYLNKTVENFPYGQKFLDLMKSVGFEKLTQEKLTFGIASIYRGDKPIGGVEWN